MFTIIMIVWLAIGYGAYRIEKSLYPKRASAWLIVGWPWVVYRILFK